MNNLNLDLFWRHGVDCQTFIASMWLPVVEEAEYRQVFAIPNHEWHGYEFEVESEEQQAWLKTKLPDLDIEWDNCQAFLGLRQGD